MEGECSRSGKVIPDWHISHDKGCIVVSGEGGISDIREFSYDLFLERERDLRLCVFRVELLPLVLLLEFFLERSRPLLVEPLSDSPAPSLVLPPLFPPGD